MQILPLVLILLVCAGVAAGVVVYVVNMQQTPPDVPVSPESAGLTEFRVSSGGDMLGGHSILELTVNKSGAVAVFSEYQEAHNTEPVIRRASGSPELVAAVEKIIRDNRMNTWKNLRDSGIYALDAATTTYSFIYNGERISFQNTDILPKGGNDALMDIIRLISASLPENQNL